MHVEVEERFLLLAFGRILLPQPHHRADDLGIVAVRLGLRVDILDVVGDRLLFFLELLDPLDDGTELVRVNTTRLSQDDLPF